ncbi:MAG: SMC family ATPase [Defluviitaleaceae bacterium]|nr:SMC family ATPase [Defluviitaleaceae bacterium]
MKPLLLQYCGINSVSEKIGFDFEKLSKTGIFGIFGATGSGKSTILDAIILALYGKIPRYGNTLGNFINTGLNSAWVKLSFEVVVNGYKRRYEIERHFERNGNKSGSAKGIKSIFSRFREIDGDKRVLADRLEKEVDAAVCGVVGLDYHDFTRSVVLPQGKFSEFMFLDGKRRIEMFERLFGLDKYGEKLNARVREYSNNINLRIKELEGRLAVLGEISPQTLKDSQKNHADLLQKIDKGNLQLEELQNLHDKYQKLHDANAELQQAKIKKKDLENKKSKFYNLRQILEKARAADGLRRQIEGFKTLQNQHKLSKDNYELSQHLDTQCSIKASECVAEYEQMRTAKESEYPELLIREKQLEDGIAAAREIDILENECKDLRIKYKQLQSELDKHAKKLEKESEFLAETESELENLYAEKETLRIDSGTFESLNKAANLEQNLNIKSQEIEKLYGVLNEQKSKHLEFVVELRQKSEELEEQNRLKTQNLAASLAQNMEENEPCPVCGSVHHPNIADFQDFVPDDNLPENVSGLKEELAKVILSIDIGEENISKLKAEVAEILTELNEFRTSLHISDTESFSEILSKAHEKNRAMGEVEKRENILRRKSDTLRTSIESEKSRMAQINSELNTIKAIGIEKARIISTKAAMLPDLAGYPNIPTALEAAKARLQELILLEKCTFDAMEKSRLNAANARQELAAAKEKYIGIGEILETQSVQIEESLKERGFENITAVEKALMPIEQQEKLEKEISEYDKELLKVVDIIVRIEKFFEETDNSEINPAEISKKLAQTEANLKSLKANLYNWQNMSAIAEDSIARLKENLDMHSKLSVKKSELEKKFKIAEELKSLFRGNEFLKYLATKHMREIADVAGARLKKMSGGRFSIEFFGDNFRIRDDFAEAAFRSPASLSGGETFIASLALALALSAKIQRKNNTGLSFFFLDEGFGSLDKELLDWVITGLEQLRDEQMTVGLITHVEELKERIVQKIELGKSS